MRRHLVGLLFIVSLSLCSKLTFGQQYIAGGSFYGGNVVDMSSEEEDQLFCLIRHYGITDLSFEADTNYLLPYVADTIDHILLNTTLSNDQQWYKHWNFHQNISSTEMHRTSDGSFLLIGKWNDTVVFDVVNNTLIKTTDTEEFFVMKLAQNGDVNWVKTSHGGINDEIHSVLNEQDELILSTTFGGTMDLTEFSGGVYVPPTDGSGVLVQKLNANGEVMFENVLYGTHVFIGQNGIDKTPDGAVFTLSYTDTLFLESDILNDTLYSTYPYTNPVVVWLDDSLEIQDYYTLPLYDNYMIFGFETDAFGNVYMTGTTAGAEFILASGDTVSNQSGTDKSFILKMGSDASLQWVKLFRYNAYFRGLTVNDMGESWSFGDYEEQIDLDPSEDSVHVMHTSSAPYSCFLLKLSPGGEYLNHGIVTSEAWAYIDRIYELGNNRYGFSYEYTGDSLKLPFGAEKPSDNAGGGFMIFDDSSVFPFSPEGTITVYPNPFSTNLSVLLDQDYDAVSVEIIDLSGQIVYTKQFQSTHTCPVSLDVELAMYLLRVKTADWERTTRIVKYK